MGSEPIGVVVGFAAEARIARRLGWPLEIAGATAAGAAAAAERLIEVGCKALVSFGLAGGLDPSHRPGDPIVPAVVIASEARYPADPRLSRLLGGPTVCALLGSDEILASVEAKRSAHHATSAAAADLESGAVARIAAMHGVPFAVLRAVCDPAGRALPPAAIAALDGRGAIGFGRIIGSIAVRPGQLPALFRLAADAAAARRSLVGRVRQIARGP